MAEEHHTEELRRLEAQRAEEEAERAEEAPTKEERLTHARRSDKADYLRRKLEERAESEREQD